MGHINHLTECYLMKSISRRNFLFLPLLALTVPFFSYLLASEASEEWSFGVIPDTQWNSEEAPFHGTSLHVIDAINREMIRHNVDFVIQVGDLAEKSSATAFKARAACNRPLEDAGIQFYPLRGNHDSRDLESVRQFQAAFPNRPGVEGHGGSSPDLPGAQGMTYSFMHKNGKFVLLDTFPLDDGTSKGKSYAIEDDLPWINAQLQAKDHRFALVFAHKNLLGQNHKDNIFSNDGIIDQDMPQDVQNAFFACLQRNHVGCFLSGHDHLYHRSTIKSPDGRSEVRQVICGSASYKFYEPVPPFSNRETSLVKELNRIGFLIVRVNRESIKFEYYSAEPFGSKPASPHWEIRDTFEYAIDNP